MLLHNLKKIRYWIYKYNYITDIIHHIHNIATATAVIGGINKIKRLSSTNKAAVFITAIANLILWYMQKSPIRHNAQKANKAYDKYSKA